MPNNLDSVIANEAPQQTSAPSCSPRLFICFSEPLQLPTKRLVIKGFCGTTTEPEKCFIELGKEHNKCQNLV